MVEPDHWRVFCAIHLPQEVREKVSAHSIRLRQELPEANASWNRPDNIHLTVKFLGDTPESRVKSLSSAAANAAMSVEPFPIGVQGSGVFPNLRAPRVLWVGIEDLNGTLARFYLRFEEECAKAGFKKEMRAFHPHLTLARLRKPQHARALAQAHTRLQLEPIEFTASELLVIRSELSSGGSKYTTISRHPFALK
jgi:2'-5' RNA ligase